MAELTAAQVTRALLDEGEGRAPVSVKKFGYSLRAFLRFCLVTGEVEHDLTGATLVIRSPRPSLMPVGISPAQIEALLEDCDRDTVLGHREYAVIVLLVRLGLRAATGTRIGEVLALNRDEADLKLGVLTISRGKSRDPLLVPLYATTTAALSRFASGRDEHEQKPAASDAPFFTDRNGDRHDLLLHGGHQGSPR